MRKFIFVTGGVVSGLGKGITAASLGRLLKSHGLSIFVLKCDPYLNVDTSNMSPLQHGEVYVTNDGGETDLDLGHYERFIDVDLSSNSSLTTGKVYEEIIRKERKGEYNGETIQIVPHVTNEIKRRIFLAQEESQADIVITEIGGTVGDIESLPYLEAIRQIRREIGKENTLFIHVTLIPFIESSNELKTKPTQHSVKELRSIGIQPDIIVCRSNFEIDDSIKNKVSLFCDVEKESVFLAKDLKHVYEMPLFLHEQGMDNKVCELMNIKNTKANLDDWIQLVEIIKTRKNRLNIGLVGKYVSMHDAYLSVVEALKHGGYIVDSKIKIKWIDSEQVTESNVSEMLFDLDGVIVPGGFGKRAVDGMITTLKYCRINNIVTFGICLGMQAMAIEFARNVLNIKDATSEEYDKNAKNKVINYIDSGKMRIGAHNINIVPNSKSSFIFGTSVISERYRHRFGFNLEYTKLFEDNLFIVGGRGKSNSVEILELKNNDFYIGIQSHPEFKSRPTNPHPLFQEFINKCHLRSLSHGGNFDE
ncbi:MAG: CTP synthase [Acholeplasmatales bacterium]|jgi:CTP synthase|nr:CTP synthase [Acholeplasmatales bacterium]